MPEIAELWIYPIKSLPGISLQHAHVGQRGLDLDRHWMLVDPDGKFITQREDTRLVRFRVRVVEDGLEVSHPEAGSCRVPSKARGERILTQVWKSEMEAHLIDPAIDAWFTRALGQDCRLVALPEDADRRVRPEFGGYPVAFVDGMPILVLSEESVADLSVRAFEEVPLNRFRANIILRGARAFEEESAARLRIGDAELISTKRCGRCLVICTDQETGERGTEPLRTLAGYRIFGQNACMGMYYAPATPGEIHVGQEVLLEIC